VRHGRQRPVAAAMSLLTTLKAFVVEDHAFQRSVIMAMLRTLGIEDIHEAANGREALAALEHRPDRPPADVILCDLEMPEMDGIEFLREVAERRLARGVIIVSGRETEILHGVEAMARASGLDVLGQLKKPVTAEQLRHLLSRVPAPARPAHHAVPLQFDEATLRAALAAREFQAEFQPKVGLHGGELLGVEALARWRRPDGKFVGPAVFIPALVRTRLITELTEHVLGLACEAVRSWAPHGLQPGVSVNLSMATLSDLKAADRFAALVRAHDVAPERVTFEVTETEIMSDLATALNVLSRLRLKGFRLAIDDFGTGYSSLAQLNSIPFNELKIDQTFVRHCEHSPRLRNIIQSSIDLARRLEIRTVAEGIENEHAWAFLTLVDCDEGQGYYIGKPMAAASLVAWSTRWRPPAARAG